MSLENSSLAKTQFGAPLVALVPTTFEEAVRIARLALRAGLYKTDDGDDDVREAQATLAIMKGMEIGIPPMQALENISIIKGRSCIWGDLIPALLWSRGFELDEYFEHEDDPEKVTAVCVVTRPNGKKITRKFSVGDAEKAKLWDNRARVTRYKKDRTTYEIDNDSPWYKYGKVRMLPMRARGYASRDGAADVLKGLYMREEVEDMLRTQEALDITPAATSAFIPSAEMLAPRVQDEESKPAKQPAQEPQQVAQIEFAPEDMLSELDVSLMTCKTTDQLYEVWDERCEKLTLAGRKTYQDAQAIFEKHEQRLKRIANTEVAEAQFDMLMVPGAE